MYRYGLMLLVCSWFLFLRLILGQWIDGAPYILSIAAVLVCALFGGLVTGLLATLVMAVVQIYFFSTPYLSLSLSKLGGSDTATLLTFILVAVLLNLILWDRRGVKSEMHDTEEQFRAAFDQAAVGMTYSDLNGRWIEVNSKYADMLGYTIEELKSKNFREITYPDDIESSEAILRRLMASESDHLTLTKRYVKKDGNYFWAEMTISMVRSSNKVPKYFAAVIEDVTEKKEAAEKLRVSEELYRTIIQTAEEGVWILDAQDNTKFVNNKMAQMMGYSVEELVGSSPAKFVGDEAESVLKRHLELRHQGISEQYDLKWKCKNGTDLWTSISTTPLLTSNGQYDGALAMISDIGKRKQYEDQIEYEHRRIHDLFSDAPAMIAVLRGPQHVFEFANANYMRTVGQDRQIIGKPVREALPELEGQGLFELLDAVYSSGQPYEATEVLAQLDQESGKTDRFFDLVYQCSRNQRGEIEGIFVYAVDVTDQVKSRQALEQSRERLELAQEAGNIGTFEWNIRTNEVIWSTKLEVLYGMNSGEFGGRFEDWMEAINIEDREGVRQEIDQAMAVRSDVDTEFRIGLADGIVRWIAMRGRLYYDAENKPIRMIGINRNVTKRKLAERDLQFLTKASTILAASLNYEITLQNVAALAVSELADWCTIDLLDDSGHIERIAQATSKRVGDAGEQLMKFRQTPYSGVETGIPGVLRTGKSVYYRQLTDLTCQTLWQSSEQLEVIKQIGFSSVIIVPVQILGGAAGAISFSLIGSNRHYDESDVGVAESLAERASAAIDNAWLYKETQVARKELEQRVEQRTQELQNKNTELNEAQKISHLGSWEWDVDSDERRWSAELYRIYGLEENEFIPTTESIIPFTHADDRERVRVESRAALQNKDGAFASEFRIIRPDGEERSLFGQGRVIKDSAGKPIKMVGTVLDITERKRVEQMKTDFVALVSHQLKTPLAIIKGYTDNILLGIAGELSDKQRQYLREMQAITTKYYYLIADLLNVSRIERGVISVDVRPVDLAEIGKAAMSNYSDRMIAKHLKSVFDYPKRPIIVLADQAKTVEAISNVIDNAIKFTNTGRIEITVGQADGYGLIAVTDSGRGMDSETIGKLFRKDQVFSGSPVSEGGSGLGLYIAKEFIRVQGGDVSVESRVGQGSKFTFKLPLAKVKAGELQHAR